MSSGHRSTRSEDMPSCSRWVSAVLSTEQAQDIARIRRSQQHLLTLINDVLNFAKVDAGQMEYRMTAVPVDETLRDTESRIAPQILAKGLHLSYKGCLLYTSDAA